VSGKYIKDESINSLNVRNQMKNLQKLGPKILQKNIFQNQSACLGTNFFFHKDYILCYSPNIHLVNTDNFDGSDLLRSDWWGENSYRKVVRLNESQQIMP